MPEQLRKTVKSCSGSNSRGREISDLMDLPLLKIKLYSVLLKHGYTKVCIQNISTFLKIIRHSLVDYIQEVYTPIEVYTWKK